MACGETDRPTDRPNGAMTRNADDDDDKCGELRVIRGKGEGRAI